MLTYSINDLEQLSGVKAHTIRIWEKRYGIIKPKRTDTNIRYYHSDDLQLVLNISFLNRNGYKISKISDMSDEEIKQKVLEISSICDNTEEKLMAMTFAMMDLDEFKFTKYLNHYIENKGLEDTMKEVVYPFLDKMAALWTEGKIKSIHESFITQIIKRKILTQITLQEPVSNEKKKMLIFLPEKDNQELSFIYIHYILRKYGVTIINLGLNTNLYDVAEANEIASFNAVLTILSAEKTEEENTEYINQLSLYLKNKKIFLVGMPISNIKTENVTFVSSIQDIKTQISLL
jgi:DNA-binding transcriptional MerR regulator